MSADPEIEQFAAREHLGSLQGVYRERVKTILGIGIGLFLCVAGPLEIYGGFSSGDQQAEFVLFPVGLLTLLSGFGLACWAYRGRANEERLYERGVLLKKSKGLQAIRWDQIRRTESRYSGDYMYGGYLYMLHLHDGRTVYIYQDLWDRVVQKIGR